MFALTDEQIVGLGDAENEEGSLASQTALGMTDVASGQKSAEEIGDGRSEARPVHERDTAPEWLVERIRDPQQGEFAKQFWEDKQRSDQEIAAYREAFATPQDARAWKEIYPEGMEQARSAAERARAMDEIDAAFYRGDAAARTQLAQRMMQQDPAAFREMVEAGAKLLGLGVQRSSAHSATQENNLHAEAQRAAESQGTAADNPPEQVVRAYREFESAANAELEKSVGTAITRVMEQALPNLRVTGARGREDAQETAPLQERLTVAVREEVEKALQSDRQLGEQVVRVLAGRRFDNAARAQVVRLIDARAQQLVPSAVKRVVGSWTQATLGSPAKREPVTKTVVANNTPRAQTRAEKTPPRNESATGRREITSRSRRVDYGRLSDEEILGM
ncbi:MAG: hypothetical protein WB556_27880 [Candidatus Acidiferrum sp.]